MNGWTAITTNLQELLFRHFGIVCVSFRLSFGKEGLHLKEYFLFCFIFHEILLSRILFIVVVTFFVKSLKNYSE